MKKSEHSRRGRERRDPRGKKRSPEYGHLVTDIKRMVRAYRRKRRTATEKAMDDYAPPGHD